MKIDDDAISISFQWMSADTRALEQMIASEIRVNGKYPLTILSRIVAFGLTFYVATLLFEDVDLLKVAALVVAASLTIWVSWGLDLATIRLAERMLAAGPRKVGWNNVIIDRYGVLWSDEVSQEYMGWSGIVDVAASGSAIWLKTHGIRGFYLPPHVFTDHENFDESIRKIKLFREEAKPPAHTTVNSDSTIH